jgi:NHS family xanthosine MFS transporter
VELYSLPMLMEMFLSEFENFPKYADSFVVKYSTIIMSISQVSETLFILAIPFFSKNMVSKSNVNEYVCLGFRFGFLVLVILQLDFG